MKSFILATLLAAAVSATFLGEEAALFQTFKATHGKTYINQAEEATRFSIFRDNLLKIEEHNALYAQGLVSYNKTINQFSDMTTEEFKAFLTLSVKPSLNTIPYEPKGIKVAASVDWRNQGYVTEVKNQGDCGSCWAFSLTGSTEGAYYKSSGRLVSLSEQQLVDCSTLNDGCNGGFLDETFPYIEQYGLQSESSYPYTGRDGTCRYNPANVVTTVSTYYSISGSEASLLEAVATEGPVSVAVDATYLSLYSSGIYSDYQCSPSELNHGVLVVGYGSENGQDYWIVKNSWGASWGENGFFRLLRGANECGVAEDDVYPVV